MTDLITSPLLEKNVETHHENQPFSGKRM